MADRVYTSLDKKKRIKYDDVDVIINKWKDGTFGILCSRAHPCACAGMSLVWDDPNKFTEGQGMKGLLGIPKFVMADLQPECIIIHWPTYIIQ